MGAFGHQRPYSNAGKRPLDGAIDHSEESVAPDSIKPVIDSITDVMWRHKPEPLARSD
jgi:hypothetical protein